MTENLIDLTKVDLWIACLAGIFIVAPLTVSRARNNGWAAVNLLFIGLILGWHAVGIFAAIAIAYLLLQGIAGHYRRLSLFVAALALAALFLLHKLPYLSERANLDSMSNALSIIGFSYVALRMVELLRAVFERRQPAPDLASTVNYLVPFHMLAAGPIQAYDEFVSQPVVSPTLSRTAVLEGAERIATGLFKKFVLAYAIQSIFLTNFEAQGVYFFVEVQFFFLWLYLDFSAYSDIAVGIGRLIGVATPENFNRPYLARNAIDFWNRWHISLSMFIRRNIFVPIQLHLARKTNGRRPVLVASFAFTIAFILCGLWHGLTINFLLWGTIHALGLVIANAWRHYLKSKLGTKGVKKYMADRRIKLIAHIITYEFVAFSLVVLFYP
jgi:D-alanyl-lipoteichoic acid acyltransferase DltB (MBOAT superfamily)